jgi:hypothetical protein
VPLNEPFEQHYMNELFKLDYGLARQAIHGKRCRPDIERSVPLVAFFWSPNCLDLVKIWQ